MGCFDYIAESGALEDTRVSGKIRGRGCFQHIHTTIAFSGECLSAAIANVQLLATSSLNGQS